MVSLSKSAIIIFCLLIFITTHIEYVLSIPVRILERINIEPRNEMDIFKLKRINLVKRSLGNAGFLEDLYYDAISDEYDDLIANKVKLLWYGNGGRDELSSSPVDLNVEEMTTRKTWYPNLPIA